MIGRIRMNQSRDYSESGLTIQLAMLDHVKQFPDKANRPESIRWGNLFVKTSDSMSVPNSGIVRIEFLKSSLAVRQGVDLKIDNGWISISENDRVSLLRTWHDEEFENVVEYPYFSVNGTIKTWNVYERIYSNSRIEAEKWTENAGFWVEQNENNVRIYHCSRGIVYPPDFESLLYKLTIISR